MRLTAATAVLGATFFIGFFLFLQSAGRGGGSSGGGVVVESEALRNVERTAVEDGRRQRTDSALLLWTEHGPIRIVLWPDLSPESVRYVRDFAASDDCQRCSFYRSEKGLLIQGAIANREVDPNTVLGRCPEPNFAPKEECPDHDPDCGCHGPIMTRGMVGWAGGGGGPDFFIDVYAEKADWWDHQHTVWGEVRDETSFATIDRIHALPVRKESGMLMLEDAIAFSVHLE